VIQDHQTHTPSVSWSKCPTSKRVPVLSLSTSITNLRYVGLFMVTYVPLWSISLEFSICLYCLWIYKAKGHQNQTAFIGVPLIVPSGASVPLVHLKTSQHLQPRSTSPKPVQSEQYSLMKANRRLRIKSRDGIFDLRLGRIVCI